MIRYALDKDTFLLDDYDRAETFTDFMPAIAGLDGVPMWVFFTNRGQCVCSFGVGDKNNALSEFLPANKAVRNVERLGFRTFVTGDVRAELFSRHTPKRMASGNDRLTITGETDGLGAEVTYAQLVGENFPALLRRLTLTNRSGKRLKLAVTDGLAEMVTYGMGDAALKNVSNLTCAYSNAVRAGRSVLYKEDYSTADHALITPIRGANFYLSVSEGREPFYICDPKLIFGRDSSYTHPESLFALTPCEARAARQSVMYRMASAFSMVEAELAPGESVRIYSAFGSVPDAAYVGEAEERLCSPDRFEEKFAACAPAIAAVTDCLRCRTGDDLLNAYFSQCFFDNVLRGGMPVRIPDGKGGYAVHYAYARKHGDLEREYNWFVIDPTKYSGGTGNYRDLCQNRRSDALVFPFVGDYNVRLFYSLLQLDGYNPLCVEQTVFVPGEGAEAFYDRYGIAESDRAKIESGLTVGALAGYFPQALGAFLGVCKVKFRARFSEGYWSDHFSYNLDLVENFLSVYPDRERELLFGDDYTCYASGVRVLPLKGRLKPGADGRLYAYESLAPDGEDRLSTDKNGNIVTLKLFGKMVGCALIKTAMLDYTYCGIEMDGGKPGWNDSMNGLPGLNASSVPEAMELYRLNKFIIEKCRSYPEVELLTEQVLLMERLEAAIGGADRYERFLAAREEFRGSVYTGIGGEKVTVPADRPARLLTRVNAAVREALSAARKERGMYPTFFTYDITEKAGGYTFERKNVSLFLEANAKSYKLKGFGDAELYEAVRQSDLFDKRLKTYKTSESLENESPLIGRVRTFKPGLYERESCFLHMHYKYLLGLLERGLYEAFYESAGEGFVCYMDPAVYGRSVLQNSSFIVSSASDDPSLASDDPSLVGRGFQPRLTGANAEVVSMLIRMFLGDRLFAADEGVLTFTFCPKLKGTLFDGENKASIALFGGTEIEYVNPKRLDAYAPGVEVKTIELSDGRTTKRVAGSVIRGGDAEKLRAGGWRKATAAIGRG